MKHEPREAIHIERSWLTVWCAHKLGGRVSQGIPRARQTVSAMLTECQMLHPAGSVALPAFLSGRKLSPSSLFDVRHFSSSLVPFKLLPGAGA